MRFEDCCFNSKCKCVAISFYVITLLLALLITVRLVVVANYAGKNADSCNRIPAIDGGRANIAFDASRQLQHPHGFMRGNLEGLCASVCGMEKSPPIKTIHSRTTIPPVKTMITSSRNTESALRQTALTNTLMRKDVSPEFIKPKKYSRLELLESKNLWIEPERNIEISSFSSAHPPEAFTIFTTHPYTPSSLVEIEGSDGEILIKFTEKQVREISYKIHTCILSRRRPEFKCFVGVDHHCQTFRTSNSAALCFSQSDNAVSIIIRTLKNNTVTLHQRFVEGMEVYLSSLLR